MGDTLAVPFIEITLARDWAASTTGPVFGALTATHRTALLNQPLPEIVWIWELDRVDGTCLFRARSGGFTGELPWTRCTGWSG